MQTAHAAARPHGPPPLTPEEVESVARTLHEHGAAGPVRLSSDEEWDAIAEALARIEAEEGGDDE